VVLQLLPRLGEAARGLVSAEWWVHSRLAGRNVGHELHFDLEERALEATGRIVHPTLSSVLYLSGGGDPTIVLDEPIGSPSPPLEPSPNPNPNH
jgi:hypothetical protein